MFYRVKRLEGIIDVRREFDDKSDSRFKDSGVQKFKNPFAFEQLIFRTSELSFLLRISS